MMICVMYEYVCVCMRAHAGSMLYLILSYLYEYMAYAATQLPNSLHTVSISDVYVIA